jgi:hypothetical protein
MWNFFFRETRATDEDDGSCSSLAGPSRRTLWQQKGCTTAACLHWFCTKDADAHAHAACTCDVGDGFLGNATRERNTRTSEAETLCNANDVEPPAVRSLL